MRQPAKQEEKKRIQNIVNALKTSPLGAALYESAEKNNVCIRGFLFEKAEKNSAGRYLIGGNIILLNFHKSDKKLVITLAHELFHAWQDQQGLFRELKQITDFTEFLIHVRVMELAAFTVQELVWHEIERAKLPKILRPIWGRPPIKTAFNKKAACISPRFYQVYDNQAANLYAINALKQNSKDIPASVNFEKLTDDIHNIAKYWSVLPDGRNLIHSQRAISAKNVRKILKSS